MKSRVYNFQKTKEYAIRQVWVSEFVTFARTPIERSLIKILKWGQNIWQKTVMINAISRVRTFFSIYTKHPLKSCEVSLNGEKMSSYWYSCILYETSVVFLCLEILIIPKFDVARMSIFDIPIDAEFHADFKNVCLSCEFFELWPFKGQKGPFSPKSLVTHRLLHQYWVSHKKEANFGGVHLCPCLIFFQAV